MVRFRPVATFALVGAVVVTLSGCAWVGRVGVSSSATQPASGTTTATSTSPDGRYVVFTSSATNLVPEDTNTLPDVFLHDNQTGTTERISVATDGSEGDRGGFGGIVSADGRYVAFSSDSDNLLGVDANGDDLDNNLSTDVFLRDRVANTTTRVSMTNGGLEADDNSTLSSMTPDAKVIVFASDATNLVPTGDQNSSTDVFVRDIAANATKRISMSSSGAPGDWDSVGGSISADGRYVVFLSSATNFDSGFSGWQDAFIRDRVLNTTKRVTVLADGTDSDSDTTAASISADGSTIVFQTDASIFTDPPDATPLENVYATVRGSKTFERVSVAKNGGSPNGTSTLDGVSDDGRFVLFTSAAKNLINDPLVGATDAFVRDRMKQSTVLVSTTDAMAEPRGVDAAHSGGDGNVISGNGRYVLFTSQSQDVISGGDANLGVADLFQRSNPVPFIFAVTPNTMARGTTGSVTVLGSNFDVTGALITFGDGVTVNSVTAASATQFTVSLAVAANATPGPRTPLIVQSGTGGPTFSGGIAFFPAAFTVT